ncbi:MAG: hypothetical protein B7Y51_08805 [Burkholderiales bacterium 28-67-8]|nr:MAG: hypothetical protein B7Y51_08805 [Burkholderiales bacterium 28-67-8]
MNARKTLVPLLFAAGATLCLASLADEKMVLQPPGEAVANTDARAIESVMKAQFDKPAAPLTVAPISIEGDFAVTGWQQTDRGGRALLRKENGTWSIAVCGGDGLKRAATLGLAGMSPPAASRLARAIEQAESKLPAEQVSKFSLFEGTVQVDHRDPRHGEHHGDGAGAAHH